MTEINVPAYSAYNDEQFTNIVNSELSKTSNGDDFYQKLIELRNEQKKSLIFMEELYNQKQQLKEEIAKTTLVDSGVYIHPKEFSEANYKFSLNTVSAYESPASLVHSHTMPSNLTTSSLDAHNHDKTLVNSSRASSSHFPKTETTKHHHHHNQHTVSKPPLPRPNSTVTFHETVTVNSISNNESADLSSFRDALPSCDTIENDLRRIEQIWNDFKFEDMKSRDFNRKFEKRVVKKLPLKNNFRKRPASASLEWVPRVTIPEPFSMTIRESVKGTGKDRRETREEREKRIDAELREVKKKFKANPAPVHVMLPLYEKLKMEEDLRKIRLKMMSQEYMKKVSKPFNLTESRKGKRVKERRHSFSEGEQKKSAEFHAQPLPDFYFDVENEEKTKEEELYKQIKNRMRAADLLNQSKMPTNMELMEKKKQLEQERDLLFLKEANRINKRVSTACSVAGGAMRAKSAKVNHEVPNYDSLYRKFVIELETRKAQNRKHTKIEPFNLLTDARFQKDPNEEENEKQKNNINRNSSATFSRSYKTISASTDAMPIKFTESQKLRESYNKEKLNDMVRKELQKEHIDKLKKMREKKLHDKIQEKIKYDPKEIDKNFARETRKKRLEQRSREEEYESKLENMEKGLQDRKLQIDFIQQENFRKTLEKKYKEALEKAGLSEHDLLNKNQNTRRQTYQIAKEVKVNEVDINDNWVNE